jgi:phosphatidylserine/phosphatidylglycerophosphate/cardiolipin synthase-like enzyme
MLLDGRYFTVGSCNLDPLSLNRMDEGALVVDDPKLADAERQRLEADLAHSEERQPAHQRD